MEKSLVFIFVLWTVGGLVACSGNQSTSQNTSEEEQVQHDHSAGASEAGSEAKKPLSPRTAAMANIGAAHVHIDYSSPSMRGRTIWGGLVAYDQVWVTGAHKATSISFSKDVKIGGKAIPAGTYGFFTIPGREQWTLILNMNYEQHLADDYDQSQDVLRLTVTPEQLSEPVESLTYEVKPTGDQKGTVSVMWERIKVSFTVEIP